MKAMALRKAFFLLLVLAASAANESAASSSVEPSNIKSSSYRHRLLTYACNSENDEGRRLLSRILSHACNSKPKTSTSTTSAYNNNTTRGSNTFVTVTLGVVAGVLAVFGLVYLIDRETFTQLTGGKKLPYYCDCSKYRIDDDDDDASDPTPFERDAYLTKETAEYLEEKHDKEVEQPKRQLMSIFWCCFRTRDYDESDKYGVPMTVSEDDWEKPKMAGKTVKNTVMVMLEEVRLRLCWRPTKEYDEKDKYNVEVVESGDNDGIKFAASSYESAEKGTAPW